MTTSIVFDHRGRTKPGKEGPVEIRITVNRESVYVNTGIRVLRKNFHCGEIVDRGDADELNGLISSLLKKAIKVTGAMIEKGEAMDTAEIRRRIFLPDADRPKPLGTDMLDWMREQIPLLDVADGTRQHYVTMVGRLAEFGKMTDWRQLTVENVYGWDAWLHQLKKPKNNADKAAGVKDENIGKSTVYNYHKCLKAMLNRAMDFEIIKANPYDRLKGKFSRGDNDTVEYLTEDEMKAIMSLHPVAGSQMAVARDIFVFQMETGLSYADTQTFKFSDYRLVNGKYIDVGHREKTGVMYVTQLTDECVEILKRYGMTLPKIDNSDYNKCLKALGAAVGIEKRLHSHMARHSFATYMVAKGARIENVSRMLGHTNITQTQRYAKILPESVLADFDKVRGDDGTAASSREL